MRIGEHPEPTGSASRHRLERSLAIGGFLVGLALGSLLGGLAPSGSSDPVRMSAAVQRPTGLEFLPPEPRRLDGQVTDNRRVLSEVNR
jgi:hypothetical protein